MGARHLPATRCSPDRTTMAPVVMTNGEPDMRRTFHEQLGDLKLDVIRLGGMTVELISGDTSPQKRFLIVGATLASIVEMLEAPESQ